MEEANQQRAERMTVTKIKNKWEGDENINAK